MAADGPLLDVEDLHIEFKTSRGVAKVVDGLNLKIFRGESVALVGESGCGKSVTMKAIAGLLQSPPAKIYAKKILFNGKDLLSGDKKTMSEIRRKALSMILQDPSAASNPVFRIGEQFVDIIKWQEASGNTVRSLLRRKGNIDRYREAAINMLHDVQLPDPERMFYSYPFQLSGGMKQRVQIAMALINKPLLLLADEPGTALDVTIQDQILRLLADMTKEFNTSVLFITHNLGVAREWTERTYVMYAGHIAEEAKTKEIFAAPKHPYTQALLRAVPKLTGEEMPKGIEGMIPDYVNPPIGCRFAPRCPFKLPVCEKVVSPLIDLEEGHKVECHLYSTGEKRNEQGTN